MARCDRFPLPKGWTKTIRARADQKGIALTRVPRFDREQEHEERDDNFEA